MPMLTVRVDKKLLKKLDQLANSRGITRSELIREAIENLFSPNLQSPSLSHPYYDPLISQLLQRIDKLERQVQILMSERITEPRAEVVAKEVPKKELVIERKVTRAKLIGSVDEVKDLLDNPWAEILKKKGKEGGHI